MSQMKRIQSILAMSAMFAAMSESSYSGSRGTRTESGLSKEQLERKRKEAEAASNRAKGLKPFKYGDDIVWALNQKNADKKATKLGLI